ncbi:MAG TPA: AbrB/MazE/SpoVT family DNA-binding domain-containing protein [Candidatus Nanoarchaeia archaeon]|nr:AbrB/MazE/SpoVT family DNA-binding domain-containing protein [Candidatus Nanoarchaeia archaeon]
MKCPICNNGEMEETKEVIEQDDVEFRILKCTHCGEELMNMKQLKMLANKYRELRNAKKITFAKWGNSLAVRIPNEIAAELNIREGKHGTLIKEKRGIKIIPV